MIRQYLKLAVRAIRKHPSVSVLHISGLSIGIMAAILVGLYAYSELSYDSHHKQGSNVFMVYKERITPNGVQPAYDTWVPLKQLLMADFPEVTYAAREATTEGEVQLNNQVLEVDLTFTDPELFNIFTLPVVAGNASNPMPNLSAAVITQETAQRFFGSANAIGQVLQIREKDIGFTQSYTVTAVIENIPQSSTLQPTILLPIEGIPIYDQVAESWGSSFLSTYVLLDDASKAPALEAKFPDLIEKIWDTQTRNNTNFKLLPLASFYDTFVGNSADVWLLIYIGIGIITIAAVNFMNLATARSIERAKEIGMRKVMGAQKNHVMAQFLTEAVVVSLLALFIGVLLAKVAIPFINTLYDLHLALTLTNLTVIVLLLAFGLVLGILSGCYPSFIISRFKILDTVKSSLSQRVGGFIARNVLVVLQFSISGMLILGTLIIGDQLRYMVNADMGFDRNQMVTIELSADDFEDAQQAPARMARFRQALAGMPAVSDVTTSRHIPTERSRSNIFVRPEGWEGDPMRMRYTRMDEHFFDAYGMQLLAGTTFTPAANAGGQATEGQEPQMEVVLNQAAMQAFGWENINDKSIVIGRNTIRVVGLIKDFNFEALRNAVSPTLHFYAAANDERYSYLSLRVQKGQERKTFNALTKLWAELGVNKELNYFFIDESTARMYESEQRLLTLVTFFTVISILVTCLGLFGLSTFIIQRRKKEISIRKVLGAKTYGLWLLMTGSFARLAMISFVVAGVISWYLVSEWLSNFAYRVDIKVLLYIVTALIMLGLTVLTVGFQTVKAALANPVNALRNE